MNPTYPASLIRLPSSNAESSLEELPKASVIIVNTNELHHLEKCLPTVFILDYPDYEVLVIDNVSTDGSIEYIQTNFPQARIVRNRQNLGYTGANNVGFQTAAGEFIAVLNPDTQVQPGWLKDSISALNANPNAGLATPKILLTDKPSRINTCGNVITFTGLTFCRGLDEPADNYSMPEVVPAVSGAAFVIRKAVLEQIGGFDERFFMYYEETDLSLRASLAGFTCLYVPTSGIFHKYSFRYSAGKCFYQERNRYFALLKTFKWKTLLVLLPTLFIGEMVAWGYSILKGPGHVHSKFRTYIWLFKNRRLLIEARKATQKLRRVDDKTILKLFGYRLNFAQTAPAWLLPWLDRFFNPALYLLSKLCYSLVAW